MEHERVAKVIAPLVQLLRVYRPRERRGERFGPDRRSPGSATFGRSQSNLAGHLAATLHGP